MNPGIVSREGLAAKLRPAKARRLTLVTAPAGYGKTTAVLDWLSTCGLPFAWLSLDAKDNDPASFWQYVYTSLEDIVNGLSQDTASILSSRELIKAGIHIDVLLERLLSVPFDFLLVLDDLHLISEPAILKGLSRLIDYLPPKMHLVFISRTEPPLDLSRHRIKWQIGQLEEADLRFCGEDISRFYQARGYRLCEDEIKEITRYTEGWAAAMVAVAMSMHSGGGIAALSRASRDIGQYLKDEVLRAWGGEKRDFALMTCVLDTLSAPLCDAVTQSGSAARLLKEISESSGFLAALDAQRREYRYHPLFRSLLVEMLQETAPGKASVLHARAGAWFREQGMVPEAIEHFLSGGAYPDAFQLIEHHIDPLICKSDIDRPLAWVQRLPQEYQDGSFKVATIYALYFAQAGRFDLSRQWLAKMKSLRNDYPYANGPQWSDYSGSLCLQIEANLLIREGDIHAATRLFSAMQSSGRQHRILGYNDFNRTDIYFYRCPINALTEIFRQDPKEYGEMTKNYRSLISKNPGYAPLGIGEYLYENNRLEEALPHLLRATEEARAAQCSGALVPAMANIARVRRAQGDMDGAFFVLDECEKLLAGGGKVPWLYLLRALKCRFYLDTGNMDRVQEWLASGTLSPFAHLDIVREFELITYARALLFLGQDQNAGLLLKRLLAFTGETRRLHSRVEVLCLLALMAYQNNQDLSAFRFMDEALVIGMEQGYVRSFLDELSPMARMLRAYTQSRRKPSGDGLLSDRKAFASALLKQMREDLLMTAQTSAEIPREKSEKILEQLTAQEKKVLELIVQAASNQEISEKLGIGLRTVKAHAASIYGKLGIKNRAQCILLVRELKLF
jgi:LuxR family maltose regulon positive regulatory protein